ncbi:GPI-GlcNAc transferase complex, PIG-H component-domain-containing protein [Usnea florida]
MLTTRPHLTTFRPSPSTVSYTVSTASPRQTFPSHLLHHCILLLRILLGFATVTILGAKFFNNAPLPLLAPLSAYLETFSWLQTAPLAFTKSLLTLRTLGIQTSTLSSSYLLPSNTRFIPTSQIRDIFIHEAFRGFEVRFYLAVVVEGEGDVVVVFPNLLPGRAIVEEVWRGARECLYEPKG